MAYYLIVIFSHTTNTSHYHLREQSKNHLSVIVALIHPLNSASTELSNEKTQRPESTRLL